MTWSPCTASPSRSGWPAGTGSATCWTASAGRSSTTAGRATGTARRAGAGGPNGTACTPGPRSGPGRSTCSASGWTRSPCRPPAGRGHGPGGRGTAAAGQRRPAARRQHGDRGDRRLRRRGRRSAHGPGAGSARRRRAAPTPTRRRPLPARVREVGYLLSDLAGDLSVTSTDSRPSRGGWSRSRSAVSSWPGCCASTGRLRRGGGVGGRRRTTRGTRAADDRIGELAAGSTGWSSGWRNSRPSCTRAGGRGSVCVERVRAELAALAMPHARLQFELAPVELGPSGADRTTSCSRPTRAAPRAASARSPPAAKCRGSGWPSRSRSADGGGRSRSSSTRSTPASAVR